MITREMQLEAALKNLVDRLAQGLPANDVRVLDALAEAQLILSLKRTNAASRSEQ